MIKRPTQPGGPFLLSCRRIIVTGANGAGKTTFAHALADATGLALYHNDALALDQGWSYRPQAQIAMSQAEIAQKDHWIIDGGPSLTRSPLMSRADCVVWLDVSARRRLWRIILRLMRYTGRVRPEHPPGNVEWPGRRQCAFARKAWSQDQKIRLTLSQALADKPHLHLKGPRAIRQCLDALQAPA